MRVFKVKANAKAHLTCVSHGAYVTISQMGGVFTSCRAS